MATLTIQTSNILQGNNLAFGVTGFNPNELVYFSIYAGLYYGEVPGVEPIWSSYNYVNASGAGNWSVGPINDAPGNYTLRVRNSDYATPHYNLTQTYVVSGWRPCLTLLVSSSTLAPIITSGAWFPCLTSLVTSGAVTPIITSGAWFPCLTALVTSGTVTPIITSGAWFPCLTSLVTSGAVTPIATSGDWFPCLAALVTSGTLKIPGDEEEEGEGLPGWVIPVAIIGGVGVIGAIAIAAMPKKNESKK